MFAVAGGYVWHVKNSADSDGDGLPDQVERSGWLTEAGSRYSTDPKKAGTMESKEGGVNRQRMQSLLAGSSLGGARVVGLRRTTAPEVRDKIVERSGTVRYRAAPRT